MEFRKCMRQFEAKIIANTKSEEEKMEMQLFWLLRILEFNENRKQDIHAEHMSDNSNKVSMTSMLGVYGQIDFDVAETVNRNMYVDGSLTSDHEDCVISERH